MRRSRSVPVIQISPCWNLRRPKQKSEFISSCKRWVITASGLSGFPPASRTLSRFHMGECRVLLWLVVTAESDPRVIKVILCSHLTEISDRSHLVFTAHFLSPSLRYHTHSCLFLFEHFLNFSSMCVSAAVQHPSHIFLSFSIHPPPPLFNLSFPFQFLVHVLLSPPPPWYFSLISSFPLLAEYSTGLGHQTSTGASWVTLPPCLSVPS